MFITYNTTNTSIPWFQGCVNLEDIKISNSVECISKAVFDGTKYYTQLKENIQGDGLVYIGKTLIDYVGNIDNVQIKEGTTVIASSTFYNCTSLTSIEIPDSMKIIDRLAFFGCTSLVNVNIPNGVTTIDSEAFYNCTSLTSIEIPGSVENIGIGAFEKCAGLTSVTIQEGVKYIGDGTGNSDVFYQCESIKEMIIPSTVEAISLDDFGNMNSLETLTLKCKCPEKDFITDYRYDTTVIQSEYNVPNLKNIYVAPEFLQGYIEYLEKYNYDTSLFKSY